MWTTVSAYMQGASPPMQLRNLKMHLQPHLKRRSEHGHVRRRRRRAQAQR